MLRSNCINWIVVIDSTIAFLQKPDERYKHEKIPIICKEKHTKILD